MLKRESAEFGDEPAAKRIRPAPSFSPLSEDSPAPQSGEYQIQSLAFPQECAALPEVEEFVDQAKEVLSRTAVNLEDTVHDDSAKALKTIAELAANPEILFGFSGPSGAGKSSLLNSILEEPNLLPHGRLGEACTPCPIHIAWNGDENFSYRAEIKFVSTEAVMEDIRSALRSLRADLVVKGSNADPLARSMALFSNIAELKKKRPDYIYDSATEIHKYVGTTKLYKCKTRDELISKVHPLLVPKTARGKAGTELWPLVSGVKIFIKNNLLKKGLVIVDIPGCGDSNTARGGRAREYMSKCAALCVVVDSLRARSDEVFSQHLIQALQEIEYNNCMDRIVLVSTKMDNFPENTFDDIEDDDFQRISTRCQRAHELYYAALNKQETLTMESNELTSAQRNLTSRKKKWTQVLQKTRTEDEVYGPNFGVGKNMVRGGLTDTEDAQNKVDELEEQAHTVRARLGVLRKNSRELRLNITSLGEAYDKLSFEYRKAQVGWLSHISERQLKEVFEQAQQIVYQERMDDAQENGGELPKRLELENRFPFFGVSSKKYTMLKLKANNKMSEQEVFETVEETGLPKLIEHLLGVFEHARLDKLSSLSKDIEVELRSLKLTLFEDTKLEDVDQQIASTAIAEANRRIQSMKVHLDDEVQANKKDLAIAYTGTSLPSKLEDTATKVTQMMSKIMDKWRKARGRDPEKTFGWSTYRSIVSNQGQSRSGIKLKDDFNERVVLRINRAILPMWQEFFSENDSTVITMLENLQDTFLSSIKEACMDIEKCAEQAGIQSGAIRELNELRRAQEQRIIQAIRAATIALSNCYIDPSAEMAENVKKSWVKGYKAASAVGPPNVLLGMSNTMIKHLQDDKVITKTLMVLNDKIDTKIEGILRKMNEKLIEISSSLAKDYKNTLVRRELSGEASEAEKIEAARHEMIAAGYVSLSTGEDRNDIMSDASEGQESMMAMREDETDIEDDEMTDPIQINTKPKSAHETVVATKTEVVDEGETDEDDLW